jgi:hypothetical protein
MSLAQHTSTDMRHAIYFVPPREHPLWHAGCEWLGRDPEQAASGRASPEARAEPCRYGFHATLKAPITLRTDAPAGAFLADVRRLAADLRRFPMPSLQVLEFEDFIALRPQPEPDARHPLRILADRCVVELDRWRAEPSSEEMRKRLSGLDEEEQALMRRFGSARVLHRWRFHMTLTDSLPRTPDGEALRARMLREAQSHFAASLRAPLSADEIAVFIEPGAGQPFQLAHRFALGA